MVLRASDLGMLNDLSLDHRDVLEVKISAIQAIFTNSESELSYLKQRILCFTNNNISSIFIGDGCIFYLKKNSPPNELGTLLELSEFSLLNKSPYRHSVDFSQPYQVC